MRRLCERPGCGAPAEVAYGIDHASLVVWVDNRAVFERELAGRLCRRHAEALVVPRGWTVDDRREPRPKLFVTKDHPAPSVGEKPKRGPIRRDEPGAVAQVLPFGEGEPAATDAPLDEQADETDVASVATVVDDVPEIDPEIDPDETRAVPWSPRLVPDEDHDEPSPVFGRLLGRAFGKRTSDAAGEG